MDIVAAAMQTSDDGSDLGFRKSVSFTANNDMFFILWTRRYKVGKLKITYILKYLASFARYKRDRIMNPFLHKDSRTQKNLNFEYPIVAHNYLDIRIHCNINHVRALSLKWHVAYILLSIYLWCMDSLKLDYVNSFHKNMSLTMLTLCRQQLFFRILNDIENYFSNKYIMCEC